MRILAAMEERGLLGPVDCHFAHLMARLAVRPDGGGNGDLLALAAALVSRESAHGHSCLDLDAIAGKPVVDGDERVDALVLPDHASWQRALDESPLVGDGASVTPLVRDAAGRIYLYRYWAAERRVADWIRERTSQHGPDDESAATTPDAERVASFRRLFASPADGGDARQAMAAVLALSGAFTVVSGGPGTGKTTTVTRILALLAGARADVRIALAAPTGKAAARLTESIARETDRLDLDAAVRARMPTVASTVHRLLGAGGRAGGFRYHAGRPIPADVLVIDEASMIDLTLMDALLAAVRPGARVVLLGDRNQLASVEAGFVFGDVCLAAERLRNDAVYGPSIAARFERMTGYRFEDAQTGGETGHVTLGDAAVELRTSYRFGHDSGIAALASAISAGDGVAAVRALDAERYGELARIRHPHDPCEAIAPLHGAIADYLAAGDAREALERLGRFRILCATRVGIWGVHNLNRAVEASIDRLGYPTHEPWYAGRPIMVTANDYQVGLFNGDVGVCWNDPRHDGAHDGVSAWFPAGSGTVRKVPIARLPAHGTAWAMTVHKSQGSEFDHVLLVLPDHDAPVLTRELLYTAVTRARRRIEVVSQSETFETAVRRTAARRSGLLDRLLAD